MISANLFSAYSSNFESFQRKQIFYAFFRIAQNSKNLRKEIITQNFPDRYFVFGSTGIVPNFGRRSFSSKIVFIFI